MWGISCEGEFCNVLSCNFSKSIYGEAMGLLCTKVVSSGFTDFCQNTV